jgi:hypothetical protein
MCSYNYTRAFTYGYVILSLIVNLHDRNAIPSTSPCNGMTLRLVQWALLEVQKGPCTQVIKSLNLLWVINMSWLGNISIYWVLIGYIWVWRQEWSRFDEATLFERWKTVTCVSCECMIPAEHCLQTKYSSGDWFEWYESRGHRLCIEASVVWNQEGLECGVERSKRIFNRNQRVLRGNFRRIFIS